MSRTVEQSQVVSEWYDKGYQAGCDFLAKKTDKDLMDWMDSYGWEGDEADCIAFENGFGASYGADDDYT